MTGSENIAAEIQSIGTVVRQARDALNAGDPIDLSPIETRVDNLCGRLAKMAGGEGTALRPALTALIDEFSRLAGRIDSRLEGLREDLRGPGGRAQALSAYGQAAPAEKPKE